MALGVRGVSMCLAAVLLVTTAGEAQTKLHAKVAVPDLCSGDSAAAFLGFAIREIRAARVFATTQKQRLALLALEAATADELARAPLLPQDQEVVYGIFQREDQAWERGLREMADGSPKRDELLRNSYRYYVDAASQELGVKCYGRLRWPALHAAARDAAEL
jgi:hypothetical protein